MIESISTQKSLHMLRVEYKSQVLEEIWSLIEDLGLRLEQDPYCDWVADWITELCEIYMLVSIPPLVVMPDVMIVPYFSK